MVSAPTPAPITGARANVSRGRRLRARATVTTPTAPSALRSGNETGMLPVASTLPDTLGFVVMGVLGFQAAYPTADPAPVLAQPVAKDLAVVQKTCSDGVMKYFSNSSPGQVIAHSPADVAPFPALMQANTPGSIAMPVPMFVAQGDKDDTVLQPFTDTFVKRECTHGSTVVYRVYPGTDHYTVRDASRSDMIAWMADRVAGRPAPSNC